MGTRGAQLTPSRGGGRVSCGGTSCSVLGAGREGVPVKVPGCLCASSCAADAVPYDRVTQDPRQEDGRVQPFLTRTAAGGPGRQAALPG